MSRCLCLLTVTCSASSDLRKELMQEFTPTDPLTSTLRMQCPMNALNCFSSPNSWLLPFAARVHYEGDVRSERCRLDGV